MKTNFARALLVLGATFVLALAPLQATKLAALGLDGLYRTMEMPLPKPSPRP